MKKEIINGDTVYDIETGFAGKVVALLIHLNGRVDCVVTATQKPRSTGPYQSPVRQYSFPIEQLDHFVEEEPSE